MPIAKKQYDGLLDSWGRRNNKKCQDKQCPSCGTVFHPKVQKQKYCSKRCQWDNNGGHNKVPIAKSIDYKGYVICRIWIDEYTQIKVREHRFIMEQYLGRSLRPDEDVHHIDGNRQNNDISNLELIVHGEHTKRTNNQRIYKKGYKLNLSDEDRIQWAERSRQTRLNTLNRNMLRSILERMEV